DEVISKASDRRRKMDAERAKETEGPGLAPAEDAEQAATLDMEPAAPKPDDTPSADDVFGDFKD
ncbi:MAG: DUF1013 domain-containing protein, partial [Pseudomonadota bacterium]